MLSLTSTLRPRSQACSILLVGTGSCVRLPEARGRTEVPTTVLSLSHPPSLGFASVPTLSWQLLIQNPTQDTACQWVPFLSHSPGEGLGDP